MNRAPKVGDQIVYVLSCADVAELRAGAIGAERQATVTRVLQDGSCNLRVDAGCGINLEAVLQIATPTPGSWHWRTP